MTTTPVDYKPLRLARNVGLAPGLVLLARLVSRVPMDMTSEEELTAKQPVMLIALYADKDTTTFNISQV